MNLAYISPQSARVIGTYNLERLRSFFALKAGWDSGTGEELKLQSLAQFNDFCLHFSSEIASAGAFSLFMSSQGELIASWVVNSRVIELEFLGDKISCFDESASSTKVMTLADIKEFFASLVNTAETRAFHKT